MEKYNVLNKKWEDLYMENKEKDMEEEIKELKKIIKEFIIKHTLKSFKVKADIDYHSKLNASNPQKWVVEYYSTVSNVDVEIKQ